MIVIYGAGKYGIELLRILKNLNYSVDYFIQSKVEKEIQIQGVKVISWNELIKYDDINILFAIRDKSILSLIKNDVLCKKRNDIYVYDCIDFIETNQGVKKINSIQGEKECIVCGNKVESFLPGGICADVFKKHHVIGGGYRKKCICPICGASDRERWLLYVLQNIIHINHISGRVLHFAPEMHIISIIKNNINIDYYTGDIIKGRAMHVTDITNMQYANQSMDYIICNHVLEHIVDIKSAISEIRRVLKDDGMFIFSFQICNDMNTFEDISISSPEERLKYYGQKDHVRLYGKDFADIYTKYGFDLDICRPKRVLTKEQIERYGFIEDDVIIIAKKKKEI